MRQKCYLALNYGIIKTGRSRERRLCSVFQKKSVGNDRKRTGSVAGQQISMIFQDPLTSLNPVFTVGSQITESICTHMKLPKKKAMQLAEERPFPGVSEDIVWQCFV